MKKIKIFLGTSCDDVSNTINDFLKDEGAILVDARSSITNHQIIITVIYKDKL